MPQLDVSTFFSQVFWFLVFFSLLFLSVNCLFLPRLDFILSARNKEVFDTFNTSIYILRLAEEKVIEYDTALSQAKVQAKKILDDAIAQVKEMRASVRGILDREDKKVAELVKGKVAEFQSDYTSELKQMATSIALIYFDKLTNSKIEEEFIASFISRKF